MILFEEVKNKLNNLVESDFSGVLCNDKEGALWENYPWQIKINVGKDDSDGICHHTKNGINPVVLIAINEGGYNSTGICLLCVLETVEKSLFQQS